MFETIYPHAIAGCNSPVSSGIPFHTARANSTRNGLAAAGLGNTAGRERAYVAKPKNAVPT
jgi:hypothetical protein